MVYIQVISNIFNFLAERAILSIGRPCDVTHVNKNEILAKSFSSLLAVDVIEEKGLCKHHKAINLILSRDKYKDGDIIFFVDHDICFDHWPFEHVYNTMCGWFSENPELLLAHTLYSPCKYDRHFKFRTSPLFAVRKCQRMITDEWNESRTPEGLLNDTGRVLCEKLELEGRVMNLPINPPSMHLHCGWIFKNNLDEKYAHRISEILVKCDFQPSRDEVKMMREFPSFRVFLEKWNERVLFDFDTL